MGQQHHVVGGTAGQGGGGGHRADRGHRGDSGTRRRRWRPSTRATFRRSADCYVSVMAFATRRPACAGGSVGDWASEDRNIEVAATVRQRPDASRRWACAPLMNQLRLDPLTGRWVVVSTDRATRPQAFAPRSRLHPGRHLPALPVLPGQRGECHPGARDHGARTASGWSGWSPTCYPAFEGNAPFVVTNRGPVFTQATAGGIHEVFVLSPESPELVVDAERRADHRGDDRHPRSDRGARRRSPGSATARPSSTPGARRAPPSSTPTASCSGCPSSPASWSRSRPASPGSPAAACCAPRWTPRRTSTTGSSTPTSGCW